MSIDPIKRYASYIKNVQGLLKDLFQIIELCLAIGTVEYMFATLIMPHSNPSVPHYSRSYPFEQVWNEDKMETAFFRSDANGLWGVLGATDIG